MGITVHEHIIKGGLLTGQDPLQEILAEQALALMVGKSAEDTTGNGYRCIEKYAQRTDMQVHTACLKVLAETEKVLNLILTGQIGSKGGFMKAA